MIALCLWVCLLGLAQQLAHSLLQCPVGYTLNGNICYDFQYPTLYRGHDDCNNYCVNSGASMLCVQNQAQNDYILSFRVVGSIWLGLNSAGGWQWVAGCTSTYFNWGPSEGGGSEPYAIIYGGYGTGQWADWTEYSEVVCFCQRSAYQAPTSQPSSQPTRQPSFQPSSQPTSGPTSQPASDPTSQPTIRPSVRPSVQPSTQPTSKPSTQPAALPTAQPSSLPTSRPSSQPSTAPSSAMSLLVRRSKSYRIRNGFSFAALTTTGAVLYWAADQTTDVHTVIGTGANAAAVNRAAVAALSADGYVSVSGTAAYARGWEFYQSGGTALTSIVGNEGAFAGITVAGAAAAFGGIGNGNDVSVSGFAAQLAAGVIAIMASAGSFTALKEDGTVFTWGNKYCGGGVSSLTRTDLQGIVKVFATRTAFAGLTAGGKVLTWGDLYGGGDAAAVSSDIQADVFHIVSTQSAFVAFKPTGQLVVWGNTRQGADTSVVAAQISSGVMFLAHSSSAFAALKTDETVVTWGEFDSGGDSSAVQSALVGVKTVVGNMYAFAAITSTGAVVAWGDESEGGAIPSDLVSSLSAGVTEVFSTNRAFAALKGATGELVLWGNPYHGGDAGAAATYLTSGVRTVCGNDAAFSAVLQDGRGVVWGHSGSVAQPGLLSAGAQRFSELESCL